MTRIALIDTSLSLSKFLSNNSYTVILNEDMNMSKIQFCITQKLKLLGQICDIYKNKIVLGKQHLGKTIIQTLVPLIV